MLCEKNIVCACHVFAASSRVCIRPDGVAFPQCPLVAARRGEPFRLFWLNAYSLDLLDRLCSMLNGDRSLPKLVQ